MGLTNPPRFPTELIQAMPAAAAAPESIPVGSGQQMEFAHTIPAAARERATRPTEPGMPGIALAGIAAAPTNRESAMCHRLSPLTSEWRPATIIEPVAALQGITEIHPIFWGSWLIVSLITCGSQNPRP